MNWTEGNLARHSRGGRGKELLQRQKQHFAKLRSGYINPNTPPRLSRDEIKSSTGPRSRYHKSDEEPVVDGPDGNHTWQRTLTPQRRDTLGLSTEINNMLGHTSFDLSPVHTPGSAAKRRRLLNMDDWTGVEVHKPLGLQFGQRKQDARSPGRSRKEHYRRRFETPIRHVLGERYDALVKGKRLPFETRTKPISIRIRVGNQDMRFGGSLVTERPMTEKRDAAASHRHNNRPLTNSGYFRSTSSRESRSSRSQHARSSSEHSFHTNTNGGKSRLRRGSKRGVSSPAPSLGILQPIPCRKHNIILDPLLRGWSPGSDAADSLIAQVGRLQPVVLPEMLEENKKWVQLVCSSESGLSTDASEASKPIGLNIISPGVSAYSMKPRVCGGEIQDLSASQTYQNSTGGTEDETRSHYSSGPKLALSVEAPTLEIGSVLDAQDIVGLSLQENYESLTAIRNSQGPGTLSIPASLETGNEQAFNAIDCRKTVSPLAPKPVTDQQIPLINDRKSEYDAWIMSFLSSEDSDNNLNQQALDDARLNAAQAIRSTQSKSAFYTENSHNGVAHKSPLIDSISMAKDVASHVAKNGSACSSMKPSSPPIEGSEESRGRLFSASIYADRATSANTLETAPEKHEWKHFRPPSGSKAICLAHESPPRQSSVDDIDLEWLVSDASIRGNAPASITRDRQEQFVIEPDLTYQISTVAAESAQYSSIECQKSAFKFAAPRLFVGNRASQSDSIVPQPATLPTRRGRKRRCRGGKLSVGGQKRTSIRHLPDYYGDPIEEFTDEIDLLVCPKSPPLFGTLPVV